jgi:hypothetical protein
MTETELDLLLACLAVRPWLAKAIEDGSFRDCVRPSAAEAALAQLQAAIKKAKGESHD